MVSIKELKEKQPTLDQTVRETFDSLLLLYDTMLEYFEKIQNERDGENRRVLDKETRSCPYCGADHIVCNGLDCEKDPNKK